MHMTRSRSDETVTDEERLARAEKRSHNEGGWHLFYSSRLHCRKQRRWRRSGWTTARTGSRFRSASRADCTCFRHHTGKERSLEKFDTESPAASSVSGL